MRPVLADSSCLIDFSLNACYDLRSNTQRTEVDRARTGASPRTLQSQNLEVCPWIH